MQNTKAHYQVRTTAPAILSKLRTVSGSAHQHSSPTAEKTPSDCRVNGTVAGMEIHEQTAISIARTPVKTISLALLPEFMVIFQDLLCVLLCASSDRVKHESARVVNRKTFYSLHHRKNYSQHSVSFSKNSESRGMSAGARKERLLNVKICCGISARYGNQSSRRF